MSKNKVTWARRLSLEYTSKSKSKVVALPGTAIHEDLKKHVGIATRLLRLGDESKRNYLSTRITFVVSDRGQQPQGKHKRAKISFELKIPNRDLFNSKDVFGDYKEAYKETGNHTEQVLYKYLKSDEGQNCLLEKFQKVEKESIASRNIKAIPDGEHRKVYAMILDMHSSLSMCTFPGNDMKSSCADATFREQKPGKQNLRAITARTFRKVGYLVSGYERNTGLPKPEKIGLKMATRLSCISGNTEQPIDLKNIAVNRHKNDLVINKKVLPYEINNRESIDCENIAKNITILKSSRQNGLSDAFDKNRNNNHDVIRDLVLTFPHEMVREGIMHKIVRDGELVDKLSEVVFEAVSNLEDKKLMNPLLETFIRINKYDFAVRCLHEGATLQEKDYGVRNNEGLAFVCYPDIEGYTMLWGQTEGDERNTFDKMVKAANLTNKEIEKAAGYKRSEIEELFSKMTLQQKGQAR